MERKLDVIAIDGPAGAGKSTVAREVAQRLKWTFLDTGAMYRAVALGALRRSIPDRDDDILQEYIRSMDIQMESTSQGQRVILNGEDVSLEIRAPEMGKHASDFSRLPSVRQFCARLQRQYGRRGMIVAEGRDMGTVVFPDAKWKFFLTADTTERARRRWQEEKDKGITRDLDRLYEEINARDYQDTNREFAPLKAADDATIIDSTDLSIRQVVMKIVELVQGGIP